jgi:hypothetical protein
MGPGLESLLTPDDDRCTSKQWPAVGRRLQALHEAPRADATTAVSRTGTPEGDRLGIFLRNGRLHQLNCHSHSLIQVIPRKKLNAVS